MPDQDRSRLPAPLVEGLDYYIENGRWVFTARYHLARGYCCGNGCRHCPYPKAGPTGPPADPSYPPDATAR